MRRRPSVAEPGDSRDHLRSPARQSRRAAKPRSTARPPTRPDGPHLTGGAAGAGGQHPGRAADPTAAFDGLQARADQATADAAKSGADITVAVLDRNTGQLVTNGDGNTIADRLGGQALHRRRPAAAGGQGADAALAGRPADVRRHAAVLGRQRRRDLLEPQRWQRDHQPGGRALRARFDTSAGQRAVVQHHQHGDGPGPLLRHAAQRRRRAAARAGQHHPHQPGAVDTDGARRDGAGRRVSAAVRHPGRTVRRTRRGQAGLDVLHRRRLDAPVDRCDRHGPSLRHGDQLHAAHRRTTTRARPSPRPSRRCSPAAGSSSGPAGRAGVRGCAAATAHARQAAIRAWSPDSSTSGTSRPRQLGGRV